MIQQIAIASDLQKKSNTTNRAQETMATFNYNDARWKVLEQVDGEIEYRVLHARSLLRR